MSADPFQSWEEEYKWENCQLGNKEYGMFLSNYIKSQKKALTLNINGQWGIGKTHFLRQIYTQLRYEEKLPTIYINAWESDFSNDPLLVIVSEILNQVKMVSTKQNVKGNINYALKKLKSLYNSSVKLLGATASIASGQAIYYTIGKDMQLEETKEQEDLSSLYFEQQQALKDLRKVLREVVLATPEKQVFVLVDELDRCRPNYAVEFLETIKHIFDIDGLVFVVATDTEQLSHSIKAIYGATFDGSEYLSRFFGRSAKLPEPDKTTFAKFLIARSNINALLDGLFLPFLKNGTKLDHLAEIFGEVANCYGLSLRRVKQLIDKYESILLSLGKSIKFDSHLLIQLLCEFSHPEFHFSYEHKKKGNQYIPKDIAMKLDRDYRSTSYETIAIAALLNHRQADASSTEYHKVALEFTYHNLKDSKTMTKHVKKNVHLLNQFESDSLSASYSGQISDNVPYLTFPSYFKYVELAATIA
ncbi:hypothetical protein CTT31_20650 [Pseudoalteromonas maricaloris]|uniref:KAP family P-loop NTPase fold protein n=1 Tax=Pseudoalteromonas maricaloris TaxID=184924 RepID=UPI0021ADB519|nr:KAP family NTPase [Pseudoalteromonas flavipulchra]USE71498.1 hypothetical protein CTT31_20650 [Pseudoalteromonas flavipulchra]